MFTEYLATAEPFSTTHFVSNLQKLIESIRVSLCVCRVIAPVIALLQLSNIEFLGLPHLNLHKIGAWSIDCVCPHSMRLHVTLFIECTRCVAITRFDYAIDLP